MLYCYWFVCCLLPDFTNACSAAARPAGLPVCLSFQFAKSQFEGLKYHIQDYVLNDSPCFRKFRVGAAASR